MYVDGMVLKYNLHEIVTMVYWPDRSYSELSSCFELLF